MSKTKRFTAMLLSATMLCSAFVTNFVPSQAGAKAKASTTPAETQTWKFDSIEKVNAFLASDSVDLCQTATKVTPSYDDTEKALKLGKNALDNATILVPQSYEDTAHTDELGDNLIYPVSGLEGKIQLGNGTGYHGATFVYDKVNTTSGIKYNGQIVSMVPGSKGLVLRFHKVSYAKKGSVFQSVDAVNSGVTDYGEDKLCNYLKGTYSEADKQQLRSLLQDLNKTKNDTAAFKRRTDNCWIHFKIYFDENKPMLEFTLNLDNTDYTFAIPLNNKVSGEKTFAFGQLNYNKSWAPNTYPPILVKEFTISYDLSDYYKIYKSNIDQEIADLGALTRDKYDSMKAIYDKYKALSPEEQAGIKTISTLENALTAFEKGAYFYDDFEGKLNWKLAGTVSNTDLTPTNDYSKEALAIKGDSSGKAFWGTYKATDNEKNQVLWLRKSFASSNVKPIEDNNQNKPSVIAITNNILPEDSKITSVTGKMYVKDYGYGANADYKQFIGLTYKYSGEYTWTAVGHTGCNAKKNLAAVERTEQGKGKKTSLSFSQLSGEDTFALKSNQWITFTLEYDFSLGCYTYEAKGKDANDKDISIKIKLQDATEMMSEVGLLNAGECAQSFDDITISTLGSGYAEGKISELPNPEDVDLEKHEVQILTVQSIMTRLSDKEKLKISEDAREKYQNVKATYERLIQERDGLLSLDNFITFETGEAGKEYFEAVNASGVTGMEEVANPKTSDGINTSATVLKITRNYNATSDKDNNRAIYKIKDNLLDGTQLLSNYSGKVYLKPNTTATIVYDYKSDIKWLGYQLTMNSDGVITVQEITKNGTGYLSATKAQGMRCETKGKALSTEGAWVAFNVEYQLLSTQLTVKYEVDNKEYISQYNKWNVLQDTCETQVGIATGNEVLFDDIKVNFKSDEDYNTKKAFVEKYDYLLDLVPVSNYLSFTDKTLVEGIQEDYKNLNSNVKNHMPFMDVKVANIKAAWEKISESSSSAKRDIALLEKKNSAGEGYTGFTFEDDFEDGLSAWMPAMFQSINGGNVSLETKKGFSGKVLKLDNVAVVTPKSTLLPNKAQLQSVSYKILREDCSDAYWDLLLFGSYIDETSCKGFSFWTAKDGSDNMARYAYGNLLRMDHATGTAQKHHLNLDGVLDVKITYEENKRYSITVTDDTGRTFETKKDSYNLQSLMAIGSWGGVTYVDDVKVVYCEGSYDVDKVTEDITVYYTGNTFQSANDYVTLNGDNLAETVKEVWIAPLTDNASGERSIVSQERFDASGAKAGQYSKDPVAHNFDEAKAVKAEIVQKTTDSLKIKLPTTFKDGTEKQQAVYTLKLISTKGESKNRVIYLNQPVIDYTVGSDGDIATQGTELRIIGKNLAPAKDASKVQVVFVDKNTNTSTTATVTEVQSVYSVSVKVPETLSNGTYEVWLHSGVGDNTAWSVPASVKVGSAVRDGWKSTVYNIQTDFGATGKSSQNATPCFVNALAAIEKNGGGILYLPNGNYCIEYTLVIPEHCRIIGESKDTTSISLRPYNFAYNHLPSAVFKMKKNVEISNVSILTSRVGGVFSAKGGENDNIYLTDILVEIEPETGSPTDGMNNVYTDLVTPDKQKEMLASETVAPVISIESGVNVQIKNVDMGFCKGRNRPIVSDTSGNKYWQVVNTVQTGGWSEVIVSYSLWENNQHGPDNCIGVWGNGTYMQGNTLSNQTTNNRELYVADRGPAYTGTGEVDANNPTKITLNGTVSSDLIKVGQVYIRSGQGAGQTRTIVGIQQTTVAGEKRTIITLDSAFHIQPNKNSILLLRKPRENIFFVENEFSYGTSCGFYGGAADVVYDSCTFTGVTNFYQQARGGDVNWYFSIINCTMKRADTLGTAGSSSGGGGINWRSEITNGQKCFLLRDCKIDGLYTKIDSATNKDQMRDMVLQRNQFDNMEYAFTFETTVDSGKCYTIDGFLMSENIYTNVDYIFGNDTSLDAVTAAKNTTNTASSKRMIVQDLQDDEVVPGIMGDVNGDGKVTLKDASMIMLFLSDQTILNGSQRATGDVDGDGKLTLKDASLIKFYVAGKIDVFPAETTKGEENE